MSQKPVHPDIMDTPEGLTARDWVLANHQTEPSVDRLWDMFTDEVPDSPVPRSLFNWQVEEARGRVKGKGGMAKAVYTPALRDELCRRVIMRPVHQVCNDEDMPSESTFYEWLLQHDDLSENYTRARKARAFRRYESLDEVKELVQSGKMDPQAGRMLMDAIKWQTGKELPKVFGDSVTVKGDKENPLQIAKYELTEAELLAIAAGQSKA